jgi:hypothetical protein
MGHFAYCLNMLTFLQSNFNFLQLVQSKCIHVWAYKKIAKGQKYIPPFDFLDNYKVISNFLTSDWQLIADDFWICRKNKESLDSMTDISCHTEIFCLPQRLNHWPLNYKSNALLVKLYWQTEEIHNKYLASWGVSVSVKCSLQ